MPGPDKKTVLNIVNLVLFQSVWFLAVLGAAAGNGWIGLIGLVVFLIVHQIISASALVDFKLAGIAILAGLIAETLMVQTNLITYKANIPLDEFAPLWLLVLWANFALTINGCISWLHQRYRLAALLGAIGGPLSYFGGLKLGAAQTDTPLPVLLGVVAILYAVVTPALFKLGLKFATNIKKPDSVS